MIESFGNRATEDLYHGISSRRARRLPDQIKQTTLYKLDMINAAQTPEDLRSPPGNRLETLKGNRAGYFSIRVNAQWRIIFKWHGSNAHDVELIDYHR